MWSGICSGVWARQSGGGSKRRRHIGRTLAELAEPLAHSVSFVTFPVSCSVAGKRPQSRRANRQGSAAGRVAQGCRRGLASAAQLCCSCLQVSGVPLGASSQALWPLSAGALWGSWGRRL